MHWLHSELQTIIYTDLSSLPSPPAFLVSAFLFPLSSPSLPSTFLLLLSLLKIQVTLLNKLPRKSFGSSHYKLHIMGYGITYITHNSASLLLLPPSLFALLLLLTLNCQEIACVKHSFIVQV